MFSKGMDPQEQLKQARREQILEAASRVFAEKGFNAAKMKDVAVAAGVSNGTVYNYYASKDEVLRALMHRLNETEQRESQFAEGLELGGFQDFMEMLLEHRLGFLWKHAALFRAVLSELLVNESLRDTYREEVLSPGLQMGEQFLAGMKQMGQLHDVDEVLGARVLAGCVLGLTVIHLLGDEVLDQNKEKLAKQVAQILCLGMQYNNRE